MTSPTEKLQHTISRLPLTDSGEIFSVLHSSFTEWQIEQELNPANILLALHKAADARGHAASHRNFNVGASVLALKPNLARKQFFKGVNVKPEALTDVNIHAEQLAIQKARDRGFSLIRIVAVVGETQNDTQSGHQMCTLHPCGLCRDAMESAPLIDNDQTLIVTATPNLRTIEFSNVRSLKEYHEQQDFNVVRRVDLPDLNILRPVATGAPIFLNDNAESRDEDRIWDSIISGAIKDFNAS
ncbi:MAG: hypothetical protein WAR37_00985 [Candidatus Microsaccharimonas sp.]